MSKEIYISSTPHETRLAIVENDALTEMYYERENEYTLAGSIYNGRVTRVLPGMQSSFVDIGLDRDAFLYITDFMEEAGDTADFEASANAGDHRGGRAERGPRPERTLAAPAAEPSDSELFTDAVSSLDPSRPASDRGDRGRRGGRGRRDRNSDGTPRRERGDRPAQAPRVDAPAPVAPILESHPDGEIGEGAPGADGSRRWRGRRGRRGNRGERETRPVQATPTTELTGPVANAYDEPFSAPVEDEGFEFDAAASAPVENVQNDRGNREGGRDGNRGGRDRNRRDRGPRTPRGFEPSTNLYQVEGSAEALPYGIEEEIAAPLEPIILPGESLRKYREPAEAASSEPVTPAPAPVDTFVAQGWDGGLVLPGETIRPRSPQSQSGRNEGGRNEGRSERGASHGRDDRRDFRGDRSRDARGPRHEDRGPRREQPAFAAPVIEEPAQFVEAAPTTEPETYISPVPAHTEPEIHAASAPAELIDSTFVPPPPMPGVEQEYEPAEASASYRIDPVAPSQYVQAAPEPETAEDEIVPAEIVPLDEVPNLIPELLDEPLHHSADEPATSEVEPQTTHDITEISAAGEMHSEAPLPMPHEIAQELTTPSPAFQGEAASAVDMPAEVAAGDQQVPYFAPGAGLLEEEELLDDEEEFTPLHTVHGSPANEQMEHPEFEHEKETLEGAADLATMIHEMSIDQITRTEGADDEEDDDFEEDFLEEDQDHDEQGIDEYGDAEESEEASEEDALEHAEEPSAFDEYGTPAEPQTAAQPAREPRREGERGRRDGRRGDRNRRSGSDRGPDRERGGFSNNSGGGRRDGGRGRQSMQSTNLPAISDLLKPGQEILVQIAKEPIAKKGARITSHIALPGRFLVFMPTVSHTGVSRKIESDGERRRLKEILLSERGDASGGFIVRTAAEGASEEELRSDLRFLLNLWADIKARSEASKSPALIYHDLNLIERVLRDQVTDNFSAIWVDTETEYERVLRFLQRFQPSLIRRVKLYTKETPLFEQFGITEEINKALRSKVWLKSGGSIVINQTEALVAIDINTGKFVGKTARLEDTIVKTNLDAIPEIVRQIRLRDLGGIIIIDFIDMDERKNRNRVMAALEEELKSDRAPSKVLQFNDFGLVAITRKRVKQSLERTLSTTCGICQGTGMVKSPVTVCNDIYIEMRKMHKHLDRGDVMLRVNPEVVKQLKSSGSRWLQEMEEMVGKTILVKSDPSLHPEQFDIH